MKFFSKKEFINFFSVVFVNPQIILWYFECGKPAELGEENLVFSLLNHRWSWLGLQIYFHPKFPLTVSTVYGDNGSFIHHTAGMLSGSASCYIQSTE